MWPFYVLSLKTSKQKKTSKIGNRCNSCKRLAANGSAVTHTIFGIYNKLFSHLEKSMAKLA